MRRPYVSPDQLKKNLEKAARSPETATREDATERLVKARKALPALYNTLFIQFGHLATEVDITQPPYQGKGARRIEKLNAKNRVTLENGRPYSGHSYPGFIIPNPLYIPGRDGAPDKALPDTIVMRNKSMIEAIPAGAVAATVAVEYLEVDRGSYVVDGPATPYYTHSNPEALAVGMQALITELRDCTGIPG